VWQKSNVNRNLALGVILLIGGVVLYALWPYVKSLLGALILFVLFKPLFEWFVLKLKIRRGVSAFLVVVISLITVLIPVSILISIVIREAQELLPQLSYWLSHNALVSNYYHQYFSGGDISDNLAQAGPMARTAIFGTLSAVSGQLMTFGIMFFMLYFLFAIDDEKFKDLVYDIVPFSKANAVRLAHEFRNVTRSTLFTSGLIALVQGSLITIGFLFFNLPGAFLWGFVACLLSFVPFVGVPAIWLCASLFLFLSGRVFDSFGFLVWGIVISNIDNFIRPYMQKKIGQIHPLVSLLGIIAGLSLFGLIGIVIGPLLLNYFILTLEMFRSEYITD